MTKTKQKERRLCSAESTVGNSAPFCCTANWDTSPLWGEIIIIALVLGSARSEYLKKAFPFKAAVLFFFFSREQLPSEKAPPNKPCNIHRILLAKSLLRSLALCVCTQGHQVMKLGHLEQSHVQSCYVGATYCMLVPSEISRLLSLPLLLPQKFSKLAPVNFQIL